MGEFEKAIEHCDKALSLGFEVHPDFLKLLKPHRKEAKTQNTRKTTAKRSAATTNTKRRVRAKQTG
jgi:hypothetical protein